MNRAVQARALYVWRFCRLSRPPTPPRLLVRALSVVLAAAIGGLALAGLSDGSRAARPPRKRPHPLRVSIVVEPGRAVAKVIGDKGGVLQATGADGTRFTLSVPANAVPAG